MTEREQVIEALEICANGTNSCNKCPMKDKCKGVSNAAMVAAIKLLKEQEPVKVRHLHGTKVSMYEEIVFTDQCEYCGGYLLKPWKACPICGRMLKWDEVD